MYSINGPLKKLLLKIADEKYHDLVTIALAWKPLVGEILAARSEILKYDRGVLYVKAANHVWMQDFVLNKPDLLVKLKEKTGLEIKNILFTI